MENDILRFVSSASQLGSNPLLISWRWIGFASCFLPLFANPADAKENADLVEEKLLRVAPVPTTHCRLIYSRHDGHYSFNQAIMTAVL